MNRSHIHTFEELALQFGSTACHTAGCNKRVLSSCNGDDPIFNG